MVGLAKCDAATWKTAEMKGQVVRVSMDAPALRDNPLGDASTRELLIYLPPDYEASETLFPAAYFLHGYAGSALQWLNVSAFCPNVVERVDALMASEQLPGCLCIFIDGWTSLGGSQWLNSAAQGAYSDYVTQDVVAFVEENFRVQREPAKRALFGKSSGGYAAWTMACHCPQIFGHMAAHSADACFEYCYLGDLPKAAAPLRQSGGVLPWFHEFRQRARATKMKSEDFAVVNILAMAASYSPCLGMPLNLELPMDLETGAMRWDVWQRWLERDPTRFVPLQTEALKNLKSLFLDCGTKDEFHLIWGARQLAQVLREKGVPHHFEEFSDGHMGINYRFEHSLRYILPRM
ncbi:MAG: alpha/beta hydrolase-fold protein [Cystobacterineae bacterium]|nr:alpha/beta hydrolase-fold protein [Cystobacterineae bacterium]